MYLTQGLHRGVQRHPRRAFSIFQGRRRSYAELATRCGRLAGALAEAGCGPGDRVRSAGRAGWGQEIRIVDGNDRQVPRGTVGEVVARGDNIMLGYWNLPDLTAETLRGGWLHTGDGGYLDDDGYLYIVDRLKDMIVSGGENVYSAEVENVLARHPAVAACAVIGIPHEQWGEGVHAVVVRQPGATVAVDDLLAFCRRDLAGYKCPRSVEFRDDLPLSGAGKVLKNALREPHWRGRDRNVS